MSSQTYTVFDSSGNRLGEVHMKETFPIYVAEVFDAAGTKQGESSANGRVLDIHGNERCFVGRNLSFSSGGGVRPNGVIYGSNGEACGRIVPMLDDRAVGGASLLVNL